jgi:HEAT repeat protein
MRTLVLLAAACFLPGAAVADDSVNVLIERLRASNPGVRGMAAEELGQMGAAAKAAIKPLAKAVTADEDLNVRYWAARALAAMGPAAGEAVPALMGALRTTFPDRGLQGPDRYYADARSACAEALGRIGAEAKIALPALREALADEEPSVREAAQEAIDRIGGKPSPEAGQGR